MLTTLFALYFLFVICRDGANVAYKMWAIYHNYVYRPYKARRGLYVQYASNSSPPFRWMSKT